LLSVKIESSAPNASAVPKIINVRTTGPCPPVLTSAFALNRSGLTTGCLCFCLRLLVMCELAQRRSLILLEAIEMLELVAAYQIDI
jgi:hypothetical protein